MPPIAAIVAVLALGGCGGGSSTSEESGGVAGGVPGESADAMADTSSSPFADAPSFEEPVSGPLGEALPSVFPSDAQPTDEPSGDGDSSFMPPGSEAPQPPATLALGADNAVAVALSTYRINRALDALAYAVDTGTFDGTLSASAPSTGEGATRRLRIESLRFTDEGTPLEFGDGELMFDPLADPTGATSALSAADTTALSLDGELFEVGPLDARIGEVAPGAFESTHAYRVTSEGFGGTYSYHSLEPTTSRFPRRSGTGGGQIDGAEDRAVEWALASQPGVDVAVTLIEGPMRENTVSSWDEFLAVF